MTEKALKYLSDILYAIDLVNGFILSTSSFEEYAKDLKTQSAVERQVGIIGEAVNKFNSVMPDVAIRNASQIVALRNRIIHAYDAIDNSIIWTIIKKYLPQLKQEASDLSDLLSKS